MKILLSWLNEYADFGTDVDALAAAMTSLGLVVEDVDHIGATVDGVVTARVLRTESHPDAARVHRVYVDTGDGALVRAVSGQVLNRGTVLAIDQTATAYALEAADDELLARLGYAPTDVAPVPQAWTALLRPGAVLGAEAARTVVSRGS